jgi:chorismate mutase
MGSGIEANQYVVEVMQRADHELRHLIAERAELTKRIGTAKRTIMGLAKLFGNETLDTVLSDVDRRRSPRQRGITRACRRVLMEAQRPMSARDVCDEIQRTAPALLARHKDPIASINTILARLVEYGEAGVSPGGHGQRVWLWAAEPEARLEHMPDPTRQDSVA